MSCHVSSLITSGSQREASSCIVWCHTCLVLVPALMVETGSLSLHVPRASGGASEFAPSFPWYCQIVWDPSKERLRYSLLGLQLCMRTTPLGCTVHGWLQLRRRSHSRSVGLRCLTWTVTKYLSRHHFRIKAISLAWLSAQLAHVRQPSVDYLRKI
jgi:hypothetical protein